MNSIHKIILGIVALAAVSYMAIGLVGDFGKPTGGSTEDYFNANGGFKVDDVTVIDGTGNLAIGTSGTSIDRINTGTCYLAPSSATITASSTALVDCQGTAAWSASGKSALAGITSGDNVIALFSTTTSAYGVEIVGASASTSASGYIVLEVANYTGTTFTWPVTGSATGTASYIVTDL